MKDEKESAAVYHRCSCGTLRICCPGELHDCAIERGIAEQRAFHSGLLDVLEGIKNALEQPRAAPPSTR